MSSLEGGEARMRCDAVVNMTEQILYSMKLIESISTLGHGRKARQRAHGKMESLNINAPSGRRSNSSAALQHLPWRSQPLVRVIVA